MKRVLNWRPDLPDQRDHMYTPAKWWWWLPKRVDLRGDCSPIEDQGPLGSCTGNAIASAIEILQLKQDQELTDISRLFIYYNERAYINEVRNDSGAYIRDGIKSIRKIGAAKEALWPYHIEKFAERPNEASYADALTRRFRSYERINSLTGMLNCLAEGYPFVFGFTVYSGFMSDEVARTGKVSMPGPNEYEMGGHAGLAVGYDRKRRHFIVRNSWGVEWGDKGYFTMPFDYLADRNLSDDLWTVRG